MAPLCTESCGVVETYRKRKSEEADVLGWKGKRRTVRLLVDAALQSLTELTRRGATSKRSNDGERACGQGKRPPRDAAASEHANRGCSFLVPATVSERLGSTGDGE